MRCKLAGDNNTVDVHASHTMRSGAKVKAAFASTALAVVGCVVLASLAAQVRIPLPGTDVPMTLQSLAVLLTGFALSPPAAAGAMLLYLGAGSLGLPLFAPGSAGLLGPTGGYLVGFVMAAWLVSLAKGDRGAGYFRLVGAGALGMLVLFFMGVAWRTVWLGGDFRLAAMTGLAPFCIKATVQVFLSASLVVSLRGSMRPSRDRDVIT